MNAPHNEINRLIDEFASQIEHPETDDGVLATILADVAKAIYGRLDTKHVALLVGVAAHLLCRTTARLPPAAYRNKDGEPCYTSEQLAAFHGVSVAEVEAAAVRISANDPDGRYVRRIDIAELTSVQ